MIRYKYAINKLINFVLNHLYFKKQMVKYNLPKPKKII